jgi:hypothetical protein
MDFVSNFGNSTEPDESLRFLALFSFFIGLTSFGSLERFSLLSLLVKWISIMVLRGFEVRLTVEVLCLGFLLSEARELVRGVRL